MPPEGGRSTPGNVVDGDVLPRRPRISRRPVEKMNPGNIEFQRQIEELEAKHQEEQRRHNQMTAFLGHVCCKAGMPYWNILAGGEDGQSPVPWNDVLELPADPSAPMLLKAGILKGEERLLKDSSKPPPDDTDFLEGTFIKINSDKQKGTRNKKNSNKKAKSKGRKQSHASEINSDPSPSKPSSTWADAADGDEALVSLSSHDAVGIPLLEYNTASSSSSLVTELLITPAVNSTSNSAHGKELSSSSNDDFKCFDSSASYSTDASSSSVNDYYYTGGNAWNRTMGDYAGSLSDARSEWSLSASECITSRGFINKTSGEGSKPNDHRQSLSLGIVPSGRQEGSPCSDYASNDDDFQKVISRKSAQKMKRMQRLESPAMAASGPIIARALVPSAPRHEVMTIGHYIKDDFPNGRKPNHKIKGKNQKRPSLSNVSKTGYTDAEKIPGTSRMLLRTVQTGKSGSSQMALSSSSTSCLHVTLEDVEETSSPVCLPMVGELKAPVGGGDTEHTDSTAPASDKTWSLGNPNSSCVDREEQGKSMAPVAVGSDTEGTDCTATSDKTSSQIGHLANSSCVDWEEPKKYMAPVGGDTKDTDYTAPSSSDKTSSLADHLANSSCVDREEQEKAMAPVGGDSDIKDTASTTPSSEKTSSKSLGILSNSSCVKMKEQKKQENEKAFSTRSSSELDKIVKAANDAYKIQAASGAYYGVHADIETFLHSATPVIAQISCTTNNISLQDQCLWNVWRWYEEPECCGIEVEMQGSINRSWESSSTYFVPSLSAVQLFGQSGNNKLSTLAEEPCLLSQNHGGLLFEYFEEEMPFSRPPLFTKIKQLLKGVNLSGNPIFGDPKQLKNVKLSDLHPASWYCVSWYPICQIPSASRSRQAAFLTYHSLCKLVPQTCPTYMADGLHRIICPIVGLLGYRDQEQKWYQVGGQSRSKPAPNGSRKTHPAEHCLNKKMRALRHCASIMSKAVVPKASGEAMSNHPDYEFFWSRQSQ